MSSSRDALLTPQCPTPQQLTDELETLARTMEPGETEESWDKIERGLLRLAAIVRGGGYKHTDVFVRGMGNKGIGFRVADCVSRHTGLRHWHC